MNEVLSTVGRPRGLLSVAIRVEVSIRVSKSLIGCFLGIAEGAAAGGLETE